MIDLPLPQTNLECCCPKIRTGSANEFTEVNEVHINRVVGCLLSVRLTTVGNEININMLN